MESKRSYCEEAAKAPFPTTLSSLLKERGITPGELAAHIGVTRQTVSNYCLGQTSPSFQILCDIAEFFNVSTDYLLGRSNVLTTDLTVQDIHKMTGLTEENIAFLKKRGPYGEFEDPFFAESYEKLTNDLIAYASTHQASRTYSRFLANANRPEPPSPEPDYGHTHSIVKFKVAAEIISGIPEDGVDYAKGYTVISSKEYSRILLDEFLRDLRNYLQGLYFDSDNGGMDNGID